MTQTPSAVVAYPPGVNHISLWNDDERCVAWSPAVDHSEHALRWVDFEPTASAAEVVAAVTPLCQGFTLEMAEAFLGVGASTTVSPAGTRGFANGARLTCAFTVQAVRQLRAQDDATTPVVGWLAFQPVSILVCGPLIATCWHPVRWYSGQRLSTPPETLLAAQARGALDLETCMAAVERRWQAERLGMTAADLGVLLIFEQALSFGPAYREVSNWLEQWELALYDDNHVDESQLKDLWGAMAVLRDWIGRLNRPGIDQDIDKAWFRGASDHDQVRLTDTKIDRALSGLGELGRNLRAAFAMQHGRLEARERERREERQRRVEFIAVLFLMPTLVVGFFGANVALPGGGTWDGFLEMVAAIVVFTALTIWVLARLHSRDD